MQSLLHQLLLCLSLLFIAKCDECDQTMINLVKQYNPMNFTNPVVNSGTGYNDFGKYDLCLANNFKYYINKITFHVEDEFVSDFEAYIGICLPEICYSDKKFEEWKSFITNYTKIPVDKISVIKPIELNSKHQTVDAVSWIYISISLLILLLTPIHFLMSYMSKAKEENNSLDQSKNSSSNQHEKLINNNSGSEIIVDLRPKNRPSFTILACFDIEKNWNLLLDLPKQSDIMLVHGLRTTAMFIVIVLTMITVFTSYPIPIRNPEGTLEYVRHFFWQLFFNNTFCYDVLFFLLGFYFANKAVTQKDEALTMVAAVKKIFFKFIKWYPTYLFIFLLYWKLFPFFLDGPVSGYLFNNEIDSCSRQWPFVVTLTQDFFYGFYEESNANYYCFGWSWFFAAYLHYYILGVLLMFVYKKSPKAFYVGFIVAFFCLMELELWIIIKNGYGVSWYELIMKNQSRYFEQYYSKFYTRISPYLIGMLIGVLYANYRSKIRPASQGYAALLKRILCYVSGLAMMLFIIFITFNAYTRGDRVFINEWHIAVRVMYNFLSRKVFVIALFLFMVPIIEGKFNFFYLGGFLNNDFFRQLSKLTVAAFLIHPTVTRYILLNPRYQLYFDGWYLLFYGIGSIALSFVLALAVSLFFEMPLLSLKNRIEGKPDKKDSKAEKAQ